MHQPGAGVSIAATRFLTAFCIFSKAHTSIWVCACDYWYTKSVEITLQAVLRWDAREVLQPLVQPLPS
jgi:hypothetical protein